MKIMLINNCYPFHSTGKIVYSIQMALLRKGHEVVVSFAWEDTAFQNPFKHVYQYGFLFEKYFFALMARITGNQYGVSPFSTRRLIKQVQRENPDIVNIHCANTYSCNHYVLLNWLKAHHIPTVLTEHAEYYYTGNCSHAFECEQWKNGCKKCPNPYQAVKSYVFDFTPLYWEKMKQALTDWGRGMQIVSVSTWQKTRSLKSAIIQQYPHCCIENGIDTHLFRPYTFLGDSTLPVRPFILLTVPGALTDNKGKNFIFEIANKMPTYQFVIVGCKAPRKALSNMLFISHTTDSVQLAKLYSAARVSILLSKRETFSLVTAESLCCATPVVGFACGGAESIALPEFSEFLPYGQVDLLIETLKKWFDKPIDKFRLRQQAVKRYNVENMTTKYLRLFREMYINSNRKG